MNDSMKKDLEVQGLLELEEQEDGSVHVHMHGSDCPRTQEAYKAMVDGRPLRSASDIRASCKGPARVTSNAYRTGWEAINWGGKPAPIGQA